MGYTGVKNAFLGLDQMAQFLIVPYTISVHKMRKIWVSGPPKIGAGPKSKMAAVFEPKIHFRQISSNPSILEEAVVDLF